MQGQPERGRTAQLKNHSTTVILNPANICVPNIPPISRALYGNPLRGYIYSTIRNWLPALGHLSSSVRSTSDIHCGTERATDYQPAQPPERDRSMSVGPVAAGQPLFYGSIEDPNAHLGQFESKLDGYGPGKPPLSQVVGQFQTWRKRPRSVGVVWNYVAHAISPGGVSSVILLSSVSADPEYVGS